MLEIVKIIYLLFKELPHKKRFLSIPILFMIISNLISLIIPLFTMMIIDYLKSNASLSILNIIIIMTSWFSAIVLVSILEYKQSLRLKKYGNFLTEKLFNHLIDDQYNKNYGIWSEQNSKEVADEIRKDLQDLNPVFSGSIIGAFRQVLIIIISLIILIYINWKITIAICLLFPFFFIIYLWNQSKIKVCYIDTRKSSEIYLSSLIEFLQTIPLMHVFDSKLYEKKILNHNIRKYLEINYKYFEIVNKRSALSRTLSSVAPLYLFFIAFIFLYYNIVSVGEIFAFWGIFTMTINSTSGLLSSYIGFQEAALVYKKIKKVKKRPNVKKVNGNHIYKIEEIKWDNLEFFFNHNRKKRIFIPSFTLKKGECVLIKGESGIGKTTFLKLILGILQPKSGNIYLNGLILQDIKREEYLSKIGYVEQNGYLYSRSLKNNILLGKKFNNHLWEKTIKTIRLESLVSKFDDGINQMLGENGIKISGGERQRILIARALYRQPEWLLLDEPFTGIDLQNVYEIQKILNSLRNQLTIILVSHNNLPKINSDRIITLN